MGGAEEGGEGRLGRVESAGRGAETGERKRNVRGAEGGEPN